MQYVVEFRLPDGTWLTVPDSKLRRVYEALWDLSETPGAVSTAALLIDEGHRLPRNRHEVELDHRQADALRQAVARFAFTS